MDKIAAAHDEGLNAHTFAINAKQNSDSRIDAAIKAIETWGSDIYRLGEEVKNMNREIRDDIEIERHSTEYWVDCTLKTFEQEKLARLESQIANARSYADTKVAGDLREEFSNAIVREITFESKATADLVDGLRTELVDLITRSNEIHSARYFQSVSDMQQVKDETERSVQTLKHSIELVDLEVCDVKESVEFSKEYMTDLSIEIEDQKELIIHEIHSEMDRDYRDLKKYVRRNMNKHLLEEHPEDDADADEVENEMHTDTDTAVNSTSVSTGTAAAAAEPAAAEAAAVEAGGEQTINEDMVIIMDDADFNSTDDDE
jgi:hypothetical protein